MFFNDYSYAFSGRYVLAVGLLCAFATACTSEQNRGSVALKPVPQVIQKADEIGSETLDETTYQQEFRFYGVVQGHHSFTETVFEPGKIVALNFRQGQQVNKGDTILVLYSPILTEKLEQAKAVLKRTQAQLKHDRQTLARNVRLFNKQLISKQELDDAERNFGSTHHTVQEAKAAVAQASNEFSDTSIVAKEAGVLSQVYKREGDFVNPGEPVFRFESLAKQKASFKLPEKLAVTMQIGHKYQLYVPAIGRALAGTIVEKSLPTPDGVRLHEVTLDVEQFIPELVGLRVVLQHKGQSTLAYKVDYQAIRYGADNQAYLIDMEQGSPAIPVSILSMQDDGVLISGNDLAGKHILVGNDISAPVNLHSF